MTDEELENRLHQLRDQIASGPSLAAGVVETLAAVSPAPARPATNFRALFRVVAALAACIVVIASVSLFLNRPGIALGDVLQKVDEAKTISLDYIQNGETLHAKIKGSRLRLEMSMPPQIIIFDYSTGEFLTVDLQFKTAIKAMGPAYALDLYALLHDFKDGKEQRLGEKKVGGRTLTGFKITRSLPDTHTSTMPAATQNHAPTNQTTMTLVLWVDPAINLPVEIEQQVPGKSILYSNLKFNEPLADDLFAFTLPEGFHWPQPENNIASTARAAPITPLTPEQLKSLTLKPGIGIGEIKFGDSVKKVEEILGKSARRAGISAGTSTQPSAPLAAITLADYPHYGLSLSFDKKDEGEALHTIIAVSRGGGYQNLVDFPGKTDKGVGIGDTLADVQRAYGPPKTQQGYGSRVTIVEYDGMRIMFAHEVVSGISLFPLAPQK